MQIRIDEIKKIVKDLFLNNTHTFLPAKDVFGRISDRFLLFIFGKNIPSNASITEAAAAIVNVKPNDDAPKSKILSILIPAMIQPMVPKTRIAEKELPVF